MTGPAPEVIHGIMFLGESIYVAQLLEYDIATQANDLQGLMAEVERILIAHYVCASPSGTFEGVLAAPKRLRDLYAHPLSFNAPKEFRTLAVRHGGFEATIHFKMVLDTLLRLPMPELVNGTRYRIHVAARTFAIEAHGAQEYQGQPYVVHLDRVYQILVEAGLIGPILQSAYLHDIAEDTAVSVEEIEREFGNLVGFLVYAVTGRGRTRRIRNAAIYGKIRMRPLAQSLKVADRIANLEGSLASPKHAKMYLAERAEFEAATKQAHPALLAKLKEAHDLLEGGER